MKLTQEQLTTIVEDPKVFLNRGFNANKMIAAKRERVDDWRRLAESITVQLKPDAGGGSSGYKQSLIENAVCNIIDLENEILEEIAALTEIQREIACVVTELLEDKRYKDIIELRYLNGQSWKAIASRLYYGEDWVCRLHGAALQAIKRAAESARIKSA